MSNNLLHITVETINYNKKTLVGFGVVLYCFGVGSKHCWDKYIKSSKRESPSLKLEESSFSENKLTDIISELEKEIKECNKEISEREAQMQHQNQEECRINHLTRTVSDLRERRDEYYEQLSCAEKKKRDQTRERIQRQYNSAMN